MQYVSKQEASEVHLVYYILLLSRYNYYISECLGVYKRPVKQNVDRQKYCIVWYCIVWHYIVLYGIVLNCMVFFCMVWHDMVWYGIA